MRPRARSSFATILLAWLALAPAMSRAVELLRQGEVEDGDDPSYALSAPTGIAASSDGRSLYVAGLGEDALDVFARNPASGALTHQVALRDGEGGVDGLGGALSAVVSADGRNVYAVGVIDQAVAVFDRDLATGALRFVWQKTNGVGGVTGLESPRSIVESHDGRHLYVACEAAVVVFRRNASGWPSFVQAVALPPLSGTQGIAVDPEGRNVYVGGYENAELRVYQRNPVWGGLTLLEVETNGQDGVEGLAGIDSIVVTPDGESVYANGTIDSSVVHFARDAETGLLSFVARHQDGAGGIDGLGLSAGVSIGGERGSRVFAGGADAAIAVFERDRASNALAFATATPLPGAGFIGSGAQVLAVGGNLYVANSIDNRVAIFAIAALHLLETESDGIDGADGLAGAEGLAVAPDGRHLYATGVPDDAVTVFAIDPANGALAASSVVEDGVGGVDGIAGAIGVTASPDGRHLYVVGFNESAIAAFARNPETGALSFVAREQQGKSGVQEFFGPRIAAVSPDGRHVYTSAFLSDSVTWFSRDAADGALSFGGFAKDGVAGVDGLDGAYAVAISPDGAHVYAAGLEDDSLAVFSRDATTGALAFSSRVQDGVAGVDGLDAVTGVTVAPDGRHVYATGASDSAVSVFTRDATSGALGFVERKRDNEGDTLRLNSPYYVVVSEDGRHVFATSATENALNVFRRDPETGRLSLAQLEQDGVDGVSKLASPRGIAIARRGLATYVASSAENAVTVFTPEPDAVLLGLAALAALAALARRRTRR
jgi:6-phosphogluconolactonase (cycloisomerase 2 family)